MEFPKKQESQIAGLKKINIKYKLFIYQQRLDTEIHKVLSFRIKFERPSDTVNKRCKASVYWKLQNIAERS